ncbi:DUF1211 domain-containing protein [Mumia sp. zg.B53]|uniref:TMEM175 family protein n=1 Tax=Mumia sp. zg.B53 TaxID=2855449 RepID=UPI001C6F0D20|nr:TMEM175 family protein [Mumia sp. zg.B53]MBW9214968.1 DUF1211 domain-containing protein [Mumia sp. zg.B53]
MLADERWTFVAFALSFAVIAQFWVGHHRLFEHLRDYSNAILWTNFVWLASIVFIPFTTQLLGELSSDTRGGNSLYIGVLIVASACLAVIQWLTVRHPDLQRSDVRGQLDVRGGLVALGLLLLAFLLHLVAPSVGMFWLLLLFLAGPVARLMGVRKLPRDRDIIERPS